MKVCAAVLGVCVLLVGAANAQARRAAFAFAEGRTLTIADDQGHALHKLSVRQGIGGFCIDYSGRHVVVQTPGNYGGQLLWCSVKTRECTQLTHGPYYYTSDKEYREVYAAPSFSPDNAQIAFAIRSLFRNPDWATEEDAIEAAGPLAVMTIKDRGVRILKSTTGKGACFTDAPLWSPDGTRILFACEEGGFITNPNGTHHVDLTDAMEGPPLDKQMDMSATSPLMWLGNNSLLFLRAPGSSQEDWMKARVFRLDLPEMRAQPIKELARIPASDLEGASDIQMSRRLVLTDLRYEVRIYNRQTGKVIWKVREIPEQHVYVQLISSGQTR